MTAGRQDGAQPPRPVEGGRVRLTVGNLKGGTAKTTTAVYLATALARYGRTLLVDADPQRSAFDWSQHAAAALPFPVIPWATRDLARRVADVAEDYEHVVIDTAPQHDAILRQALLATGRLVVPVGPMPMELRRLPETFELAAEVDGIVPVDVQVLLVKMRAGTKAAQVARALLAEELRLPVLGTATHLREAYAMAFGTCPQHLGEYDHVLAELAGAELVEAALRSW